MQLARFFICLALLFISTGKLEGRIQTSYRAIPHPKFWVGLSNLDVIKTKLSEVEGKRHKREFGGNIDCTIQCLYKYIEAIEEILDDKLNVAWATGVFDSATQFDEICNIFGDTQDCLGECCDFPNRAESLQALLGILDQMCVENYDDWKEAMPCFEQTEKKIQDECHTPCGGEAYLNEQMERLGIPDDDRLDALGNICNFLDCAMDCSIPILDSECQGTDASKLVKSHVAINMHINGKLLGTLFPQSCQALTDKYEDYIEQIDYEVPVTDDSCDEYDD